MTIATIQDVSVRPRETNVASSTTARSEALAFGLCHVDACVAFRNLRMMRLLVRIGRAFNKAGVDVLLLKGAALNLTLYERADDRPMDDLDLLVRPADVEAACAVLEALGGLRGKSQVREDFFPRFHYEIEYTLGHVYPVKIDLHVRPFRPLRYAQTVADDAFWDDAQAIDVDGATMLHPSPGDMLIHLATHCAIHGNGRDSWLTDIARWIERYGGEINWDRFVQQVCAWRLVFAVGFALDAVEKKTGVSIPADARDSMDRQRVTWRDRLTVTQAPHDASRPARHVFVSAVCTPNPFFVASYLWSMAFPGRTHMADWYGRCHFAWLPVAHFFRVFFPAFGVLPRWSNRLKRVEVRKSKVHGLGVFARCSLGGGEVIKRFAGRRIERGGMYVVRQMDANGVSQRVELTGDLRYLNHSCSANAKLERFALVAVKPIPAGKEITIDYGPGACSCRERAIHTRHTDGFSKSYRRECRTT